MKESIKEIKIRGGMFIYFQLCAFLGLVWPRDIISWVWEDDPNLEKKKRK